MKKKSFLSRLDKSIDKIEEMLKKVFSNKLFWYILSITFIYFIYLIVYRIKFTNMERSFDTGFVYYTIQAVVLITITIILILYNNKKLPIHKKYLIMAVILGIAYLTTSPVFTQSDESYHFIRAYQVASGDLISPRDENGKAYAMLPESIYDTLWDDGDYYPEFKTYSDSYNESQIALNKDNKAKKNIRAGSYIFLNYIPHALGIKIGIMLNLPPYFIGWLGRISNFIVCILISYMALKILPIAKKTISILLLAPAVISYYASMSADGLVVAMTLLLVALTLKCIHEKPKLDWKWYLLFMVVILFVATCKVAYLPLIAIVLFLPYDCFKNKETKWLYTISLIILGIIFSLISIRFNSVAIRSIGGNFVGIRKYIHFFVVFLNTYTIEAISYIKNIFAGDFLYHAQIIPHEIISVIYCIIFVLSYLSEDSKFKIRYIDKVILGLISFVIITLISHALFTANTNINSNRIIGIQGRYFVPILLLLPFFVKKKRLNVDDIKLFDIALLLNLCILLHMFCYFSI